MADARSSEAPVGPEAPSLTVSLSGPAMLAFLEDDFPQYPVTFRITYEATQNQMPITFRWTDLFKLALFQHDPAQGWQEVVIEETSGRPPRSAFDPLPLSDSGRQQYITLLPGESHSTTVDMTPYLTRTEDPKLVVGGRKYRYVFKGGDVEWWYYGTKEVCKLLLSISSSLYFENKCPESLGICDRLKSPSLTEAGPQGRQSDSL